MTNLFGIIGYPLSHSFSAGYFTEKFKKDAEGEKGVTGGNAARLLFWPAIVGTYMNANEAIAAADNRKVHLANIMTQKNCQIPGMYQSQQ